MPRFPIGGDVGAEIRSAVNSGKEVAVHERQISAHGWTGYGYTIVDPDTGAGAYLIEGKGSGGILDHWAKNSTGWTAMLAVLSLAAILGSVSGVIVALLLLVSILFAMLNIMVYQLQRIETGCTDNGHWASRIAEFFGVAIGTQGIQGVIASLIWSIFSGAQLQKNLGECRK